MIIMEDLTVSYDGNDLALEHLSLTIDKTGIIGIIGPNGAGKSTMMKAMLNLVEHGGHTKLDGQGSAQVLKKIAYVEQKSQIDLSFPMTVKECVGLGLYKKIGLFKYLSKSDWQDVAIALQQVGLEEFSDRPINSLSGGQFQRMLIARCLIQKADYIFLDEPFVGIDSVSESIIVDILKMLKDEGKTILVVHHDLSKVNQYFDQLIILDRKLIAYGDVDDVYTMSNLKAAYGESIIVEGEVKS
ncbi:metal ABC transporter ATP-binding protein [Streptococcus zalophi]|uniref:metal ABC transporter ATP-binding protein n=1 Tax=Streptococcus zalophi TaxID=640031 RepID=UPI00215C5E68|nr:metal ABC transporter ATP-binding protein [Streptococcus zalophi]MCR8967644.1 metal ABC transporter ATP-binding protein [Streptococcus zalophi]